MGWREITIILNGRTNKLASNWGLMAYHQSHMKWDDGLQAISTCRWAVLLGPFGMCWQCLGSALTAPAMVFVQLWLLKLRLVSLAVTVTPVALWKYSYSYSHYWNHWYWIFGGLNCQHVQMDCGLVAQPCFLQCDLSLGWVYISNRIYNCSSIIAATPIKKYKKVIVFLDRGILHTDSVHLRSDGLDIDIKKYPGCSNCAGGDHLT